MAASACDEIDDEDAAPIRRRDEPPPMHHRLRESPVAAVFGIDDTALEVDRPHPYAGMLRPQKRPADNRLVQAVDTHGRVSASAPMSSAPVRVPVVAAGAGIADDVLTVDAQRHCEASACRVRRARGIPAGRRP